MKTIAVFGGTFNPLHLGHEQMIKALCSLDFVDKVLVIPTKIPPHKTVDFLASDQDRINMCVLACKKHQKAEVSDIELSFKDKSYTFNTLIELKKLYPDKKLYLSVGGDMLTSFTSWYRYEDILKMVSLLVFKRKTDNLAEFESMIETLCQKGADISLIDADIDGISSTEVRRAFEKGEIPRNMLSAEVLSYLNDNKIYGAKN